MHVHVSGYILQNIYCIVGKVISADPGLSPRIELSCGTKQLYYAVIIITVPPSLSYTNIWPAVITQPSAHCVQ